MTPLTETMRQIEASPVKGEPTGHGPMNIFEEKPRWPGAPLVCQKANLPAFKTEADLRAFHAANGPSCYVEYIWHCSICKHFHAKTSAPDPAGASSGTTRHAKGQA